MSNRMVEEYCNPDVELIRNVSDAMRNDSEIEVP